MGGGGWGGGRVQNQSQGEGGGVAKSTTWTLPEVNTDYCVTYWTNMLINLQPKGSPPNIVEKRLSPKGNTPTCIREHDSHMVCSFTQETGNIKTVISNTNSGCYAPLNLYLNNCALFSHHNPYIIISNYSAF